MSIEDYALRLVVGAIRSRVDSDRDEDGLIAIEDHEAACELALRIASAVEAHPEMILAISDIAEMGRIGPAMDALHKAGQSWEAAVEGLWLALGGDALEQTLGGES